MKIYFIVAFLLFSSIVWAQNIQSDTLYVCGLESLVLDVESQDLDSLQWYLGESGVYTQLQNGTLSDFTFDGVTNDTLIIGNSSNEGSLSILFIGIDFQLNRDSLFYEVIWIDDLVNLPDSFDVCENEEIVIDLDTSFYYSWQENSFLSISVDSAFLTINAQESFSILINSEIDFCQDVDTIFVSHFNRPEIELIDEIAMCFGDTISLTASVSNYTQIHWAPADLVISQNLLSAEVSLLEDTYLFINASSLQNGSCQSRDSLLVRVNPLPQVDAGDDLNLCYGDTVYMNGLASDDFFWSPPIGLSDTTDLTCAVTINQTQEYFLNALNEFGCTNSDNVVVSVIDLPNITIDGPASVCVGAVAELSASGAVTYSWDIAPGLTVISNGLVSAECLLPYTYVVTGFDVYGCYSVAEWEIDTLSTPTPLIAGSGVLCAHQSLVEYSEVSEPTAILNWTIEGGDIMGQPAQNNIFVNWSSSPEFCELSVEAINLENGCIGTFEYPLEFSSIEAPEYGSVYVLTGNLLACSDETSSIHNWGKTNRFNGIEEIVNQGEPYCYFANLDVSLFYYWVEHGNFEECLTRTYFNLPDFILNSNEIFNDESNVVSKPILFPNPSDSYIKLNEISSDSNSPIIVAFFDSMGQMVMELLMHDNSLINISGLEVGCYLVRVQKSDVVYKTMLVKI